MSKSSCSEKEGLKKGPWTQEEDEKLIDYIRKHGHGRWRTLPNNAGLKRCGKSCRLRWTNYLRPDIKRGRFSFEEDQTIIHLHSLLGNKWSTIAARLPGRTDNEIKNYWNTNIRKRLLKMGIDPITHTPRLDLLELTTLLNSTLCTSQCSISQNPNYNCVFESTGQLEFSNQNLVSLGFAMENNNSQETLALEQHFSQTQYQYFRQNQLLESPEIIQTKTRDFSTNSINHCANETQFTQTKVDHLSQTLMNRSATLQNNVQAHQDEGFVENRKVLTGYQYSTQSSPITEVYSLRNNNNNQECFYDFDDFANTSFTTSLISTPLMRNYRCSTETSQEENDQRDGFLSTNMFMYDAMRFSS